VPDFRLQYGSDWGAYTLFWRKCFGTWGDEWNMTKRKGQGEYKLTPAQELLRIHLKELGLSPLLVELHIPEDSHWRFDLAAWNDRILFEISGGNFTGGHRRGSKQEDEYNKINTAQMAGWRVMQFTNSQVLSGKARDFLKNWLSGRQA